MVPPEYKKEALSFQSSFSTYNFRTEITKKDGAESQEIKLLHGDGDAVPYTTAYPYPFHYHTTFLLRSTVIPTYLLCLGLPSDYFPLNLYVKISHCFILVTRSAYLIQFGLNSFFLSTKNCTQHFVSKHFSPCSLLAQSQTVPVQI